jgi:hypothetical protein
VAYFKALSQSIPQETGASCIYPQPVPSRDSIRVLHNANQEEYRSGIPRGNMRLGNVALRVTSDGGRDLEHITRSAMKSSSNSKLQNIIWQFSRVRCVSQWRNGATHVCGVLVSEWR